MSWLDTLQRRGAEAQRRTAPPPALLVKQESCDEEPPEIKLVWFQTRRPRGDGDTGGAELAQYSVADGVLTLHGEWGAGKTCRLRPDQNPAALATVLASQAYRADTDATSDFNRPLNYDSSWMA